MSSYCSLLLCCSSGVSGRSGLTILSAARKGQSMSLKYSFLRYPRSTSALSSSIFGSNIVGTGFRCLSNRFRFPCLYIGCVRCAGPDCEIRNCKKGTLLCSNCGGGHSAAHKSCPALRAKNENLFHQKQQKSHADVLISRQKHQLDEIISMKEQVSEIAHLKSEFLAPKTELAEVKAQNKRYEKNLSELITYSIFHTKNT